ncbi:hypothetical protein N7513_003270 [Penicillium frequentans]|uniref:Uncharacterized protein n=1 Tax=Penicillium frequentans TaxID=3151616 RepID=A0AAD6G835_9EURO|nr:hypothetical protein N7494_013173 [Penicillium glabrum]KAJ5557684.1 hypothetical protein N7513_003270 [Penicillium glabrum]
MPYESVVIGRCMFMRKMSASGRHHAIWQFYLPPLITALLSLLQPKSGSIPSLYRGSSTLGSL